MQTYMKLVAFFVFLATLSKADDGISAGASDLTYHFFSQRSPKNSIKVKAGNTGVLRNTPFSVQKDTLFLIHGWRASNDSDFNKEIKETILSRNDINVFVVDWSLMAGQSYPTAKGSVVRVGQFVADFINELKSNFGLQLNSVKFVGWSLGAHISGNAGAALRGNVDRITGLDPAGPLFTVNNRNERLDESDAKFVQVIHTNNIMGFNRPSGHADYYPNGGNSQPGCGLDLLGGCSHSRVFNLYSESLLSNRFVSRKCGNWNDFQSGRCINNNKSIMGQFVPDYTARGLYYLETNDRSPFARG